MKDNDTAKMLRENAEKIFFIHYSCENLNDANKGYSPRITSIAVLHMETHQMSSFSMHLLAEEMQMTRAQIAGKYDLIETKMLNRFFSFAKSKGNDAIWLHWNMQSINFGFETLEHRLRVLSGKKAYHIKEEVRFNLPSLVSKKYGSSYAKDPKMINLMEMNGGRHREVLSGLEEVTAFKEGAFVKMHNSTMRKVSFLRVLTKV